MTGLVVYVVQLTYFSTVRPFQTLELVKKELYKPVDRLQESSVARRHELGQTVEPEGLSFVLLMRHSSDLL